MSNKSVANNKQEKNGSENTCFEYLFGSSCSNLEANPPIWSAIWLIWPWPPRYRLPDTLLQRLLKSPNSTRSHLEVTVTRRVASSVTLTTMVWEGEWLFFELVQTVLIPFNLQIRLSTAKANNQVQQARWHCERNSRFHRKRHCRFQPTESRRGGVPETQTQTSASYGLRIS